MKYCETPIIFEETVSADDYRFLAIKRQLDNVKEVIDNWVDTIVFTAIRRFKADEDFGFSFWDNEFIAMNLSDFNNGIDYKVVKNKQGNQEREQISSAGIKMCERSIKDSLSYYIPYLQNVQVDVQLSMEKDKNSRRGENSKYVVRVFVKGRTRYDEYAGTRDGDYRKEVEFFMDPFMNSK